MKLTESLADIIESAAVPRPFVWYERRRLPWWKAVLRRRRYEYVYRNPIFDRLLERKPLSEELTWQQVAIERLTD